MAEYIFTSDRAGEDDEKPEWMYREFRDHNRRYDCDGKIFEDGRWGGLVCKKCHR